MGWIISLCETPEGFYGLQNATRGSTEISVGSKMGEKYPFNIFLLPTLRSAAAELKVLAFLRIRQSMTDRSSAVFWMYRYFIFVQPTLIIWAPIPFFFFSELSMDRHHHLPSIQILHNTYKHIIQVHQSCLGPCKDVYLSANYFFPVVFHSTLSSSSLIMFSPMIYSVILTSPYRSNNHSECTCISSLLAVPMFRKRSYGKIKALVDLPLISYYNT